MTEQALKNLRRAAREMPFDEVQARWDCGELVAQYRATKGLWHRSASPARIMAEMAGDTYHFHTGKFPGRAIPTKKKSSGAKAEPQERRDGHYPDFIKALLLAAGVSCTNAAVNYACQDAGRKLNKRAGLEKLPQTLRGHDHPLNFERNYREKMRARILITHVAGQDELGFDVPGGYEPARNPEWKGWRFDAAARRKLGILD